jgi:hypothetical protein
MGADYLCGSVVTDMEKVARGVRSACPLKKLKETEESFLPNGKIKCSKGY